MSMKTPWNTPIDYESKTRELNELQENVIREISEDHIIVNLRRLQFQYASNSMVPGETKTPFDDLIQERVDAIIRYGKEGSNFIPNLRQI